MLQNKTQNTLVKFMEESESIFPGDLGIRIKPTFLQNAGFIITNNCQKLFLFEELVSRNIFYEVKCMCP